ncbi:MAG: sigma-54-dependent Fis family transcriptional regulator, partial [Clostridia bacterium]|nr:sigma-54-dependent Fis family transcriptional regulator [Clostridia bacterium]
MRVLVVDDEPEVCNFFRYLLEWQRYEVTVATSGEEAKAHAGERRFDVALVDLKLPDVDGLAVLRHIKNVQPECEVIIMTGYSTIRSAVEAIKLGAYDYLQKPFEDIEELAALIARAGQAAQQGDATWPPVEEELGFVIGHNPAMQRLITMAHKVAPKEITV